jgi:transposase
MPNRYPAEQRERATRMALNRLEENGSAWAVAHALGPKLRVGPETLRKWVLQAQIDAGARAGTQQRGAGRDQAVEEGERRAA